MASYYLAESYEYAVDHGGRSSEGVVGDKLSPLIREKIYLHVLPLSDAEIAKLVPRLDEDGNKQHGRLAPPGEESFCIARAAPGVALRRRERRPPPDPADLGRSRAADRRRLVWHRGALGGWWQTVDAA